MKYKITDKVLDYSGKPLKEGENDLDWREVIRTALNSQDAQEKLTPDQQAKCYRITTTCYKANEVELTVEETAFIIERIRKFYRPVVIGRAEEFFNKKEVLN